CARGGYDYDLYFDYW
nr:immunoglobulin heavy chain junction region [Mus musculus]NSM04597.1 immunoglobulin heavy chain junction region [Mus musculus]NSM05840.1 immunoglobulin heavy chain junction region [Mus musculus]NSM07340.1 immunoglobulin heavy chain junction region [Mus musculus]NSM08236.1 immunoglobulin heavy chain junction region [Mus musculus]